MLLVFLRWALSPDHQVTDNSNDANRPWQSEQPSMRWR